MSIASQIDSVLIIAHHRPPMPREDCPLRVGVIGAGTVGGKVIEALQSPQRLNQLSHRAGRPLELAGIARRNRDADPSLRDLCLPPEELIGRADVVIELMGGIHRALEVILAAIREKKTIITANKAVIAHHFTQIVEAARRCGVRALYSASVGGGMDMLSRVDAMARGERITALRAIVNATSNAILTSMQRGATYADALQTAQDDGIAEADPTLDVNGDDAVQKLTILIARAFGLILHPSDIPQEGITGVTAEAIEAAVRSGRTIKHAVEAERVPGRGGNAVRARAGLVAAPLSSLFGATGGVQNVIMLRGERTWQAFFGQGAGGAATAETVLNDLVRAAQTAKEPDSPFDGHFQPGTLVAG